MKTIKISLQDFAVPWPRQGSLAPSRGPSPDMQKGIELHLKVQKKRKSSSTTYESEKKISCSFEKEGWKFQVDGRMDGVYAGARPKIEEIKTTFALKELKESLEENLYNHPYGLQLLSYGYFYWLDHQALPELTFHLISTRTNEVIDLPITLDLKVYEAWLTLRLEGLIDEAKRANARAERRKKISMEMNFPFSKPRPGQLELVNTVEETFAEGKNLLVQAPTGLGKTVGVLYPSLKEALSRGQKVVYVTPKNSQQEVAEEALEKIRGQGRKVKSLTLTAKSRICMKDEALCDPRVCEFAKDYYDKLTKGDLRNQLAKKRSLSARTFRKMAQEHLVCPYELQLEAVKEADAVIGDYNHVFAASSRLSDSPFMNHAQKGAPNLIIDEAHNLPSRTMAQFSPAISVSWLHSQREDLVHVRAAFKALKMCEELVLEQAGEKRIVELSLEKFEAALESVKAVFTEVPEMENNAQAALLRVLFLMSDFTATLELAVVPEAPFFVGYYPEGGGTLKITCCDASELIRPRYESFEHVVAFSATIRPFDFYSRLSGLYGEKLKVAEFASPYSPEKRKILIIPQVSTKYSQREQNYPRIADAISRISSVRPGNYLAFFPSFEFLEKTAAYIKLPEGFQLIKQTRGMGRSDVDLVLSDLRSAERATILFAVQGGIFSEGIDYPGKTAIGAFIIGPPLPNFDFERERMREHYEASFKQGAEFAYTYPAMAKAIQAAGRIIRSENDHGIIVLMDDRFLSETYAKTMPKDWFEISPQELVSRGILKDLKNFWDSTPY